MDEASPSGTEVKNLRYLKWLVSALTLTMIGGFLTIVALFVMRFSEMQKVEIPDEITMPDGERATAFTRGEGWFAIVTEDDEILIYDRATGNLMQRVQINAN